MQNNFPKAALLISMTLFLLSCFAFVFFQKMVNDVNAESQVKEEKWQNEVKRRDAIKALDRSIKMIEEERKQLETHFAKSSDIVPFLDTLEELAIGVGASAEITSVDVAKDHTGLLVGMRASGGFENLYKFLTLLENSPYELEFLEMNMEHSGAASAGGKNAASSKWDASFKLKLASFIE